jgi:hypothetical protein
MKIINSNFIGIFTIILSIFALTSCSLDPVDKTYNRHTADDDYRRIKDISRIDSVDAVLLGKYMVEHNLAGPQVMELHATYKDILNEAKKEKERYEIEKRKKGKNEIDVAKSHEVEKIKNLKKVLFVDFVKQEEPSEELTVITPKKGKKTVVAPVNKNLIVYDVMFKNVGDKDIRAFKGDLNFYDIFHAEIKKITFSSFQQINVGDSIVQKFVINIDEVNKGTNTYNDLKKDFIKVEWLPDRLIHTDDEVIE